MYLQYRFTELTTFSKTYYGEGDSTFMSVSLFNPEATDLGSDIRVYSCCYVGVKMSEYWNICYLSKDSLPTN